jgi:putative membrane protein insertion efficiency factor
MMTAQKIIRQMATAPIVIYQQTLSLDHGPMKAMYPSGFCPFYPSCSEYCRQSILKDGVAVGIAKGAFRILRCHPWTDGGIDKP